MFNFVIMNWYIQQIHCRDNIHNRDYHSFYYRDGKKFTVISDQILQHLDDASNMEDLELEPLNLSLPVMRINWGLIGL